MGNCLVTKLNGVVENDNLQLLGLEKNRVSLAPGAVMRLKFNKAVELTLTDGTFTTGLPKREFAANSDIILSKDSVIPNNPEQQYCTILIPKYYCYDYGGVYPYNEQDYVDLTGYEYGSADNVQSIYINMTGINIKTLQYVPLEKASTFNVANCLFKDEYIDLTPLGSEGKLTSLGLGNIGTQGNVFGVLDNLGKSDINWNNYTFLPATKNVSIDLVNFVNNRRNAGATTGTITFRYLGAITVKANGTVLDVPVQSNNVLVWDASSITLDGAPVS